MKAEDVRSVEHEVGYLVVLTISLLLLSVIVFPLFLALLPVATIVGIREIWRLDHLQNKKQQPT